MKWEQVDNFTMRAKIHKGWLVKHYEEVNHFASAADGDIIGNWVGFSICYVPDPMHSWTL